MKKIKETNDVIRTIENGDKYLIRYIGREPVTSSSVEAKANLQDAYIVHSNMKGN